MPFFYKLMNQDCYKKAIRLLTQRDYSRPKLRKKLVEAGFEYADANEAVEEVYKLGYLKEDWYIEARIKAFMRKGYSQSHIKQRLANEELNVTFELIDAIFNDNGHDESGQMLDLLSKKGQRYLGSWPEMTFDERQKVKVKLVRALASKGFNPSQCLKSVDSYFSDPNP